MLTPESVGWDSDVKNMSNVSNTIHVLVSRPGKVHIRGIVSHCELSSSWARCAISCASLNKLQQAFS